MLSSISNRHFPSTSSSHQPVSFQVCCGSAPLTDISSAFENGPFVIGCKALAPANVALVVGIRVSVCILSGVRLPPAVAIAGTRSGCGPIESITFKIVSLFGTNLVSAVFIPIPAPEKLAASIINNSGLLAKVCFQFSPYCSFFADINSFKGASISSTLFSIIPVSEFVLKTWSVDPVALKNRDFKAAIKGTSLGFQIISAATLAASTISVGSSLICSAKFTVPLTASAAKEGKVLVACIIASEVVGSSIGSGRSPSKLNWASCLSSKLFGPVKPYTGLLVK